MKKGIFVILAASAIAMLIPGASAEIPALRTRDMTGYSKDAVYDITVLPEEQQSITDWGICTTEGGDKYWHPYSPQYQAAHSASLSDSGITMFRTGMPPKTSYNEDKTFDNGIMALWFESAIKPQVDAGMTSYLISCWYPPEWMRYYDSRGWVHLREECEDDMAEWIVRVFDYIKEQGYPAPVAYSVQNEPADPGINNYTPEQLARVTKKIRRKLDESGYSDVRLALSEAASINQQFFLLGNDCSVLKDDPEYADAIDIFAHHSYLQNFDTAKMENYMDCVRRYPDKEVWQTEFCYGSGEKWYSDNEVMDSALITARTFITDIAWIGCNNWMYWTDILIYYRLNEDGDISAWGRPMQQYGTMALGEGDDGFTRFRKTPTYNILKLIYKNAPVGSVVHRMSTNDPSVANEPDYQTDLVAFDTPKGTTAVIVNADNYPKHYNLTGFEGKSATIYSIAEEAFYKTDKVYKNIQDGKIREVTIPAFSVNVVVSSEEDVAPPGFFLDLDPMIFKKDGVYYSRNNEIDFAGVVDEDDAMVFMDGGRINVNVNKFSEKINITEHPQVTLYGLDKFGNRSENYTVSFKNVPQYVGLQLDTFLTKYNVNDCSITGKVNTQAEVYANDISVTTDGENKFIIKPKLTEGENQITIYAKDSDGNKSGEEKITLYCDTVSPDIEIVNKVFSTENPQYLVKGKVSEQLEYMKINGQSILPREDLSFAGVVYLNEGENSVKIEAKDLFGNTSEKEFEVTFTKTDRTPHLVEGEAYVRRAANHINIDGKLDEADWKLDLALNKITEGSRNNVVQMGMLWDNQYLYMAVKAEDDSFKIESSHPFNNDCVEIFINPSNNKAGGFVKGDKQLFSAFVDNNMSTMYKNAAGEIKSAWTVTEDGYICEIAIPWYTVEKDPGAGVKIGYDVVIDDNDIGADNRNTCIAWWGEINNYASTSGYGTIILTDEEKISYRDIPYTYFDSNAKQEEPTEVSNEPDATEMKLMLNGELLSDAKPVMTSRGRTMVSADVLAEKMGFKCEYLLGRNIIITLPNRKTVSFYDTLNLVEIDGVKYTLELPPAELINDDLYLTADFVAMFIDGNVEYKENNSVVNITGIYR